MADKASYPKDMIRVRKVADLIKIMHLYGAAVIGETFCIMIPDLYGGSSEPIGPESKTYEKVTEIGFPDQAATADITKCIQILGATKVPYPARYILVRLFVSYSCYRSL